MNYSKIGNRDIANGTGVRVSLFVSGCSHHCEGCFQPETWNSTFGKPYTKETEDEIIKNLRPEFISGLTLLGGEPFEIYNQKEILHLLRRIRKELPWKTIWCYSGFTFEELTGESRARCEFTDEILSLIDVLVNSISRRRISLLNLKALQIRELSI